MAQQIVKYFNMQNQRIKQGIRWTPQYLRLSAWYDAADKGSVIEAAGSVSQWNDKSGNGNHTAQGTGAYQPTLIKSDPLINKMPSVFSSRNTIQHLSATSQAPSIKRAYFICYYGNTAETFFVEHNAIFASTDGNVRLTGRTNETKAWDWYPGDSKNFDYFNSVPGIVRVNGSDLPTGQIDLPMPATLWNVTSPVSHDKTWRLLGNGFSGWNNYYGGLGEIIFTDGTENLAAQQKIEGYLAWKWGLEGDLPSGHPYKDAPPYV